MRSALGDLWLSEASEETRLVVALVSGSHFVQHTYLLLLPPIFLALQGEFHVSLAALGLAAGVVNGVVVVLQLPLGYVSDTHSREWVLGASHLFGVLGTVLVAVAQNYWWLLGASVVVGVGVAGHHPAHFPMLADAARTDERGRAFSLHGFAGILGFAAPFALTSVVLGAGLSWRYVVGTVAVVGALYGAACLAVVRTRVSRDVRVPDREPVERDAVGARVRAAIGSLVASSGILALTLVSLLSSMASFGVQTYVPVLLTDAYGFAPTDATTLTTVMIVAMALLVLAGGVLVDRVPATSVLFAGFLALAALAAVLATGALPLPLVVALVVPLAATLGVARPARAKLGDALSERDELGKNFGVITIGISVGAALAPPLFGLVTDLASINLVFYLLAGVGLAACVPVAALAARATDRAGTVATGDD